MKHWHSELRTVRVKIAKALQTLVIVDARCSTPRWKQYQLSKVDIAANSQLGRKIAYSGTRPSLVKLESFFNNPVYLKYDHIMKPDSF